MIRLPTLPVRRRRVDPGAPPSQLDLIAEVNVRAARQHRGRLARQWAVAGAAVVLVAATWWFKQSGTARTPALSAASAAAAADDQLGSPAMGPSATGVGGAWKAGAEPAASPSLEDLDEPTSAQATVAAVSEAGVAEDRARRARGRRETEARAVAPLVQQERLRLELQERQQHQAERDAQQARELADASARRTTEPAPLRIPTAQEPVRGVGERCQASSNIVSELFCHSRECRKPEHASDVMCTRLREIEEARRSSGQ